MTVDKTNGTPDQTPADQPSTPPASIRAREATQVFDIGCDHHRRGRLDDAIRAYVKALVLNPDYPEAYTNMGVALRNQGKFEAALVCYRRSLNLNADNPGLYSNMGNVLRDLGRHNQAMEALETAMRLDPDSPNAVYNLGLVLRDVARLETALTCFDKALAMRPGYAECAVDRGITLLMMGNYEKGFRGYGWRWKRPEIRRRQTGCPLWDGTPLEGRTLLITNEQGVGNLVQFARYVPVIAALGGSVIIECPSDQVRLIATVPEAERAIIENTPLPAIDVSASVLDLPMLLGTTLDTVPNQVPYLTPPELHNVHLPAPPGTRLKVGIVWHTESALLNEQTKSCPLRHFVGLMDIPGVAFYSLQNGAAVAELKEHATEALITDVGARLHDLADSATAIAQLDLVITIDAEEAHIAGALAKPVWTILPFASDWRWMTERLDSPWYPTMRLFRQPGFGDWNSVFNEIRPALEALCPPEMSPAATPDESAPDAPDESAPDAPINPDSDPS